MMCFIQTLTLVRQPKIGQPEVLDILFQLHDLSARVGLSDEGIDRLVALPGNGAVVLLNVCQANYYLSTYGML